MTTRTAPNRLPLAGHAVRILRSPLEFFMSLSEHGDVVLIRLGTQPAYVVTDPQLVRQILVRDAKRFDRGVQFEKARPFLGDGLFTEPEPMHLRHRRLLQPAFHHARLAEYVDLINDATQHRFESLRNDDEIDIDREALTFTVGALCRTLICSSVPSATVAAEVERSVPEMLNGDRRTTTARTCCPCCERRPSSTTASAATMS